jgi:hypothetical protein
MSIIFGTPVGLILSLVGLCFDAHKRPAIIGLILSAVAGLLFFGAPAIMILCG